jgi:hypothetical protein
MVVTSSKEVRPVFEALKRTSDVGMSFDLLRWGTALVRLFPKSATGAERLSRSDVSIMGTTSTATRFLA